MSESSEVRSTIRGAIRVTLRNSTEQVVAGQEFSVFVTVQNPFEVPLKVRQVRSHIPTEFTDIEQQRRLAQIAMLKDGLGELASQAHDLGFETGEIPPRRMSLSFLKFSSIQFRLPFLSVKYDRPHTGTAIARDLTEETQTVSAGLRIPFTSAIEITRQLRSSKLSDESREKLKEKLSKEMEQYRKALVESSEESELLRVLQPGNSTTKVFTFRTSRGLGMPPSSYVLKIEIEYELDDVINIDSVEYAVPVKTSVTTMMFGSGLGALAGWFVRNRASLNLSVSSGIELAVAVVVGCMLIVLFGRKKDIQPFISVEDFWGGMAIGFVSGYLGVSFLDSIVSPAHQPGIGGPQAGALIGG